MKKKRTLAAQLDGAKGYQIAPLLTFDKRYDRRRGRKSSPSGLKAPRAQGHS